MLVNGWFEIDGGSSDITHTHAFVFRIFRLQNKQHIHLLSICNKSKLPFHVLILLIIFLIHDYEKQYVLCSNHMELVQLLLYLL